MQRKIRELTGAALDYAVALAEGWKFGAPQPGGAGSYRFPLSKPGQATLGCATFWPGSWDAWSPNVPHFSRTSAGDDIIDREGITTIRCDDEYGTDAQGFTTSERIPVWAATMGQHSAEGIYGGQGDNWGRAYTLDVTDVVHGATRREAAMRAWVISHFGRSVWNLELNLQIDIPEELL